MQIVDEHQAWLVLAQLANQRGQRTEQLESDVEKMDIAAWLERRRFSQLGSDPSQRADQVPFPRSEGAETFAA
jgi:hypothetical protein